MAGEPRPDFARLGELERSVVDVLGPSGVVRAEHVVAFAPPFAFHLWLGTRTDVERDRLRADPSVDGVVRELAAARGLGDLLDGLTVESQETVDREYEGSWFYRLR